MSQPWEKENNFQANISIRKKIKLFAKHAGFGVLCCSVLYTSLLYSSAKYIIVGKNQHTSHN